jgi:Zn-dependent protease
MEKQMKGRITLIRLVRGLSEGFLPLLFWISLIFGFDKPYLAVLTVLCALIHELGHITVILLKKVGFRLRGHLSGFRISERSLSYGDKISILLGGPMANILVFLLIALLPLPKNGYLSSFGELNLITALSNLMPIEGYDGYGIISSILERYEIAPGVRLLKIASFLICIAAVFLSLYLLSRYNFGYWIFGLYFSIILAKIKENSSST